MQRNKRGCSRRNLLVVRLASIKELQRLLGVDSESEAVRISVEDRLLAEKLATAADGLAKRGGLVDVFKRSAGSWPKKRIGIDSLGCKGNLSCRSGRHGDAATRKRVRRRP